MTYDFKTTIIVGKVGTGKTTLITKYIDEIIENINNQIIVFDSKSVEYYYENQNINIIRKNHLENFKNEILPLIYKRKKNQKVKKLYLIIDEFYDFHYDKECVKEMKMIIKNRKNLNIELIISSIKKEWIGRHLIKYSDSYIELK